MVVNEIRCKGELSMSSADYKEELLIQALQTQYSILKLLDNTLHQTYIYQKGLPENEQNTDVMNLAYQVRSIISKKPRLKEIYKRLDEEFGVKLD